MSRSARPYSRQAPSAEMIIEATRRPPLSLPGPLRESGPAAHFDDWHHARVRRCRPAPPVRRFYLAFKAISLLNGRPQAPDIIHRRLSAAQHLQWRPGGRTCPRDVRLAGSVHSNHRRHRTRADPGSPRPWLHTASQAGRTWRVARRDRRKSPAGDKRSQQRLVLCVLPYDQFSVDEFPRAPAIGP